MGYPGKLSAAIIVQLRVELAARDLSRQDFSQALGIPAATLSRYMQGHRNIPMRTFFNMAQVLGMKSADLLAAAEARLG